MSFFNMLKKDFKPTETIKYKLFLAKYYDLHLKTLSTEKESKLIGIYLADFNFF